MSTRNRTATIITGAAVATALAGAAAFAAVPNPPDAVTMNGMPAHMQDLLDEGELDEMQGLMADGASVGSMHRWMNDAGIDPRQLHDDMARSGMNHGRMHRNMATTAR